MQLILSDIEQLVYDWLTKRQIPFESQVSVRGGVFSLGGAKIDFILIESRICLRIQGEYYHTGVTKEGSDIIQKEMLSALGYTVVDIWGQDLLNRLDETLTKALLGEEMLK